MSGRAKVLVEDAGDIGRLMRRLLLPWTLPRIEVHASTLPSGVLQLAQHRISRLAEACNCLLGEVLGGTILLGGSFAVWVVTRSWRDLLLVMIVALYAGLIGKAVNVAWTRARLLLVLLRLRRQLGASADSSLGATDQPGLYHGLAPPKLPATDFATRVDPPVAAAADRPAAVSRAAPQRPRVVLRNTGDIDQLLPLLTTRWTLPRVEIRVAALPALDAQRAQHRIAQLAEACNCVLGALLAAATLLGGGFYILMVQSRDWVWTAVEYWSWIPLAWALVIVPGAALLGTAIEVVWTRARLLRTLRRLRSRVGALEAAA